MGAANQDIQYKSIFLINDDETTYDFVIELLTTIFSKNEAEAEQIANSTHQSGKGLCGKFPSQVADVLFAQANDFIGHKEQSLKLTCENVSVEELKSDMICGFCEKPKHKVETLISGKHGYICDECVQTSVEVLRSNKKEKSFTYSHELLNWHFDNIHQEQIITSNRLFPSRVRADLQLAINEILNDNFIKFVGIHNERDYDPLTVATLFKKDRNAKMIGPIQFEDVDIGETEPVRCLVNGLWLKKEDDIPYAILITRYKDYSGHSGLTIEFGAPAGELTSKLAEQFFTKLVKAVNVAQSYRGKVLSLEQSYSYSGMSSGITVHKLPSIKQDEVILPTVTKNALDRNVINFAKKRGELKKRGQSAKKGLLFYGPPGTGKTHTIKYLASNLPDHTTLLVTAEQVGLLDEYFTLARLLQPSILVIEDVDLIAKARETINSPCEEALLNKLLNEMDGLNEDSEVFFVLTTNRPDSLEEALASRPGRVDQAIEFPLPDKEGRENLVKLYSAGISLDDSMVDEIVNRTENVSGAFIKELMRRSTQYSLDRKDGNNIVTDDVKNALDEMLFTGGQLNKKLLGGAE